MSFVFLTFWDLDTWGVLLAMLPANLFFKSDCFYVFSWIFVFARFLFIIYYKLIFIRSPFLEQTFTTGHALWFLFSLRRFVFIGKAFQTIWFTFKILLNQTLFQQISKWVAHSLKSFIRFENRDLSNGARYHAY